MKNFYARKIFPYDPTYGGKYSKYNGYCLSASNKTDPHIIGKADIKIERRDNLHILSSPLQRAKDTAEALAEELHIADIAYLAELSEIPFDMKQMLSNDEYERFGSNLVRERFIEAFFSDTLSEKRNTLQKRIKKLIANLSRLPNGNYVIVSHSFFLKLVQIYLTVGDLIFEQPKLVEEYIDPTEKTFDNGKGFDFSL
jgi:hypothetical protein